MTDVLRSAPDAAAAPGAGRSTASLIRRDLWANAVVIALIVGGMQIWSQFAPNYVMPSPSETASATGTILGSQFGDILITLLRLFYAVGFAMVAGCLIGAAMAMIRPLQPYLKSLVVINTGIPALSWMLFAIFWFKDAETRIFFILAMILIPFYALNIYDGIRALSTDLVEMVETFRPTRLHVFLYLIVPHIVPYVLMTTKSIIGYAARMTVFAELLSSNIGMGARMGLAQNNFHMDQVIAWTVLLVVLNLSLQALVAGAERLLLRWRPEVVVR
ncbi:MAG: ABC transporter permease [Reyranellaceae bacterium]